MARSRSTSDHLLQSEEFIEIALSSIEREMEAMRERMRRLAEVADQLRQRRVDAPRKVATAVTIADVVAPAPGRRRRNNMSPESRKKLSDRMRRRWIEYRKAKAKATKQK